MNCLPTQARLTIDFWTSEKVLLNNHEGLLRIWHKDSSLGHPFFRDGGVAPSVSLHEHERFGNLNYATHMRVWSASKRLQEITRLYAPNTLFARYSDSPLPRELYIGDDLWVSSFFSDLCSALEGLAGQIVLVYGYPISLRGVNLRKVKATLRSTSSPYCTVVKDSATYDVAPSSNLITQLLSILNSPPGWVKMLVDYRNHHTHKTFFATILDKGGLYLPRQADILPSRVIDPLIRARDEGQTAEMAQLKRDLLNDLALHEYCAWVYARVRTLIETAYSCVIETYRWRLENPQAVINPHKFYRFSLSYKKEG